MMAVLLMMAAPAQQGAHLSAVATARILPGVRIMLADQRVQDAVAEPQRRVAVRQEEGQSRPLHLIEFQ